VSLALGPGWSGPPELTPLRVLTEWTVEPVPVLLLVVLAGAYLAGVQRLTSRGDRWPVGRTACWLVGVAIIAFALLSGLATYDTTLFSVHMAQHMLLSMVAPIALALGAPVTLALRVLPLGGRRTLTAVLHARVVRLLTHPLVALALFIGTAFALYFTGLYGASLRSPVVHEALHMHLLAVGCLFLWPILGIDPIPGRVGHGARMLVLVAALPFHAFLGIAILSSTTVFGDGFYEAAGRPWGASPLADQRTGGGILWAAGELVGAAVLMVVLAQWMRSEERLARRTDREADRTGDAELTAYNARLEALALRSAQSVRSASSESRVSPATGADSE
jgi:putative membrane protein